MISLPTMFYILLALPKMNTDLSIDLLLKIFDYNYIT